MTFYLGVGRLGCGSLVPHVSRYMQLSPIHALDCAFRQQMCSGISHWYSLLDHIGERRVIINWSMLATSVTRVWSFIAAFVMYRLCPLVTTYIALTIVLKYDFENLATIEYHRFITNRQHSPSFVSNVRSMTGAIVSHRTSTYASLFHYDFSHCGCCYATNTSTELRHMTMRGKTIRCREHCGNPWINFPTFVQFRPWKH